MKNLPELTRGEEEVMQILWELGAGGVNEIIALMKEPKPKYTTIATFVKILENKGFVDHEVAGKGFRYYPVVAREQYAGRHLRSMLSTYFGGSLSQLVSFFSKHENISHDEMSEILEIMERAKASAKGSSNEKQ